MTNVRAKASFLLGSQYPSDGAFVMVLPCSRHMFVRPVLHLDQHAWTEAHVAAFRYFDGVPRRLVPDNLKTGVDKPGLYDPTINVRDSFWHGREFTSIEHMRSSDLHPSETTRATGTHRVTGVRRADHQIRVRRSGGPAVRPDGAEGAAATAFT